MFATILYGIFIIVSVLSLIGWYLMIKKIRHAKSEMASEKLFLIAIISLLILLFTIWRVSASTEGLQWKGWNSGDSFFSTENQEEIDEFTRKVYQPLIYTLGTVDEEVKDMDTLLDDINNLIDEHPRHSSMLIKAKEIWKEGVYELRKEQKEIKKSIRRAWIAHDTKNQNTVDTQFSRKAVKLDQRMNTALQKFRKLIIFVHSVIRKDLVSSQQRLGKRKKKTDWNSRNSAQYSTSLAGKLLAYSKTLNPVIHQGIEMLINEIAITEQRQEKNKQHLEENKDLTAPLIKVIDYWKAAEIQDRYYYDQLLYALESALLGRKLGLKEKDYGIVSMHKTLKKQVPKILKRVQKNRITIDHSY
jgi:hypothetical protein